MYFNTCVTIEYPLHDITVSEIDLITDNFPSPDRIFRLTDCNFIITMLYHDVY